MNHPQRFAWSSRVLHWTMALALLGMLSIGMGMVNSLDHYHFLLAVHRPLGISILLLVIVRFVNRQLKPPPPFLATMSGRERRLVTASERLLYALMFSLPLIGWGMLSAAAVPVRLGPMVLPAILPHDVRLYVVLRRSHTVLAYLLFFTFLGHLSLALFHTLVLRDGMLRRMLPGRARKPDQTAAPLREPSIPRGS